MALSFPASPTTGQTYTANGRQYVWNPPAWELVAASGGGGTDARWDLFLPPAPTSVAASAGNAQATVSWTAPTPVLAQTPITNYVVQYQPTGGSWTTFTRSASTSTTATVTGLTNGTAYTFRVAAVNGVGQGPYSALPEGVYRGVPVLTSNTSSGVASASAILANGLDAFRAFDKATVTSDDSFYASPNPATGSWVQYDFGSGVYSLVGGYSITSRYLSGYGDSSTSESQTPRSWTLSGSNDGTTFTVIDTQTNPQSFAWGQTRTFTLSAAANYRVYRWTWTSSATGGPVVLPKIQLLAAVSTVTPSAGDAYYGNVSLLLHADGTGSTFIDSSLSNLSFSATGDATQSATQSKFGGKSLYLSGSSSYISAPNTPAANFGGDNFTIELWMRASAQGLAPIIHQTSQSGSQGWILWNFDLVSATNATRKLAFFLNGTNVVFATSSDAYVDNEWTHIAVVRSGNTVTIYSNGTSVGSTTFSGSVASPSTPLMIGGIISGQSWDTTKYFTGYIDDVRITKGVARSITVPTAAFPDY